MTDSPGAVFREEALRRYAAGQQHGEPLRDISSRLLVALWACAALLGCCLLGVAVYVAALIR